MLSIYQKYIISNFFRKFIFITIVFLSLVIILNILEEISFFKKSESNFLYPYILTLLNAPITLFEIFPFIFLLSVQYLFYDLFNKNELILLKNNGLSNFKIIKIIFLFSIFVGLFNVTVYYNLASIMKFKYSEIKNKFSKDNKYLAMINDNGIWIKDEIDGKKIIVKSKSFNQNYLLDNIINEFDDKFQLIRTIKSDKIDIEAVNWKIFNPIITLDDNRKYLEETMIFKSNFKSDIINNLFSNIYTLDLLKLYKLKKNYEKIGYSTNEIKVHILKLFSMPLLYGLLCVLSSIIMFNSKRNKSLFFYILNGIFFSVIIYYLTFIFNSLGSTGVIPIVLSIFFPLIILMLINAIGLVNINDK
jgi:lipopolysaccharide export system permease protein